MSHQRQFGTIRKLASGRYQARFWRRGLQIAAPDTFATKADANAWLASVETDQRRGEFVDPAGARVRFGHYAELWLDQRPGLRPRTRETYRSQLAHITVWFAQVRLDDLGPVQVREWHAALHRTHLHANSVAKVYRLFRTILDTAVDDGLLRSNPCHIRGAAAERTAERPCLTWDEVSRLAAVIEPRFEALVWTAAMSGLRFGELTGLARQHVSTDFRTIRVERTLSFVAGSGVTFGPPKSDAGFRTVAIPDQAAAALAAHLDRFTDDGIEALVFTSLKGSPLLNRYFQPSWHRAKTSAGVEDEVRFHDLRHLAGTTAATAGASLKEIMARLGQSSPDHRRVAAETRHPEDAPQPRHLTTATTAPGPQRPDPEANESEGVDSWPYPSYGYAGEGSPVGLPTPPH